MKCHFCSSIKMWFGKLIRFIAREWSIEREVPRAPAPLSVVRDRPIKIVFVVEYAEAWGSYESVYHAFNADENCEVAVVAIAESSSYQGIKNKPRDFLAAAGIPFYSSDRYDLTVHRPDVVFFHRPYEYFRPREWQLRNVSKHVPRTVFISYGFEIGGGRRETHFNQPMQTDTWRVFVYSNLVKQLFALHSRGGDARVFALGHPIVDSVLNFQRAQVSPELKALPGDRKVVLWCSHYSARKDNSDMSAFAKWHETIVDEFAKLSDLYFIFRPHPLLFAELVKSGVMTKEQVESFKQRLRGAGNIHLDESPDFRHAFALSDGMIIDGGTFTLLYPCTGKPVMYLGNPDGRGLNEVGEIVRSYYPGNTRENFAEFLQMVARGEDSLKPERMAKYRETVVMPPQGAGVAIRDHIMNAIRRGV